MPTPRPSLALVLDVDESLATQDTRLEVNRCYAHVCSTVVRTHETAPGDSVSNTATFLVKFGSHKYLHSSNEGADELWDDVVERWLHNTFHKVGNNMKIYNRRQREIAGQELYFDWLDVDLQNKGIIVRIRLDSNSDLPPETSAVVSLVRQALNSGILGESVVSVQLPSDASYALQLQKGLAAKAERDAKRKAERAALEQAEAEAAQDAVRKAAEDFIESPDLINKPEMDEAKAWQEEMERKFAFPEADFTLDYTKWGVFYADGSTRDFDSATGTFEQEA